jgi:hypothetical protein
MSNAAIGTALAIPASQNGSSTVWDDEEAMRRLKTLPSEIGILLIIVGIAGIALPGPVGTPFVIAGGVTLWPSAFEKVERWFQRRFPRMHQSGMEQIERYLTDLEKRYPGSTTH